MNDLSEKLKEAKAALTDIEGVKGRFQFATPQCDCMQHKPYGPSHFNCPDCGQEWVLANCFPGNYWERVEDANRAKAAAERLISKHRDS